MGVGSTLGRRRGKGATWGGLLPLLTLLPAAALGHLPPGTQHCSLEMGMTHSAKSRRGKRPRPGSQPQRPCPTPRDCSNSLPLLGSRFAPWEMCGFGAMASMLLSTLTCTEPRRQQLGIVAMSPCHRVTLSLSHTHCEQGQKKPLTRILPGVSPRAAQLATLCADGCTSVYHSKLPSAHLE